MDINKAAGRAALYSFLILWLIESLLALGLLFLIPTDPKNSFLFGFSTSRLLLIIAALGSIALPALALFSQKTRYKIVTIYSKLISNNVILLIILLAYALFMWRLPLVLAWVEEMSARNSAITLRVLPILFLILALAVQSGILVIPAMVTRMVIGTRSRLIRISHAWQNYSKREKSFTLISILIGMIIAFVILEVGLRIFLPQPTYSYLRRTVGQQYAASEFLTFTLRANYSSFLPSMERPGEQVDVKVNSLGLRGEEISLSKPEGAKRILVLGDSYTFGVFVANKDTYPAVLQDLLRQDGQIVEVLNAGYADGWDPDEHYAWLVNRGVEFEPDLIIYGFFIFNDLRELYSDYWYDLDSRGLPTKVFDDRYFVDETGGLRARTDTIYAAGSLWLYRIPVLRESHVFVLLANTIDKLIGSFPENGTGDKHEQPSNFLDSVSTPEMQEQEELFIRLVEGMSEVAREIEADFLVVMIPISWQVIYSGTEKEPPRNYFEEVKPVFDEMGISYLDILELMLATPGHYFPDNGEVHNNENGYRFIAEQIKNYLDQHDLPRD